MIDKGVLRALFATMLFHLSVRPPSPRICHIFHAKFNTRRDTIRTYRRPIELVQFFLLVLFLDKKQSTQRAVIKDSFIHKEQLEIKK